MAADTKSLNLPDILLDYTEGKSAIIIGGQGGREDARKQIQRVFGFVKADWYYGERGGDTYINRAIRAIQSGGYQIVILLVHFASHSIMKAQKEAKKLGLRVVMLPGGYSPQAVSHALLQQLERQAARC